MDKFMAALALFAVVLLLAWRFTFGSHLIQDANEDFQEQSRNGTQRMA